MAISPSIPTSFVPKQPLDVQRKKMQPGDNIFLLISLVVLGVSVVTAGAVFGYQKYLESVLSVKSAALQDAQEGIVREQVEELVRLRDRIGYSKELLSTHVVSSRFFTVLEAVTLQSVRFEELEFRIADDRTGKVELSGIARNFNTLAAQSNEIAAQKDFKRAIFSDISLNPNGTVSFTLRADLDPALITMLMPEPTAPVEEPVVQPVVETPVAPATTTTPAATSTAPTTPAL